MKQILSANVALTAFRILLLVYIALYTQVILVQKFLMIVYNHQLVCITKTDLVLATSDVLTIY